MNDQEFNFVEVKIKLFHHTLYMAYIKKYNIITYTSVYVKLPKTLHYKEPYQAISMYNQE